MPVLVMVDGGSADRQRSRVSWPLGPRIITENDARTPTMSRSSSARTFGSHFEVTNTTALVAGQ
jgi:hypothetical protein